MSTLCILKKIDIFSDLNDRAETKIPNFESDTSKNLKTTLINVIFLLKISTNLMFLNSFIFIPSEKLASIFFYHF
ncbi:hypothetical protein BpHYR1_032898 [Brachionus plicatilis]|uniref:Uncharacterized protein n=1 Tax=Brachionus plicatilis TaxID=10195 RepID=A0A3M7QKY9_BRAPC|nr:hypothetical protein BpHYR1_032898 [Brachionus plicatilis]